MMIAEDGGQTVSGGRAVDHELGEPGWVEINHGSPAVFAMVVMTKRGKLFRTFGGSEHQNVFRWWKIERPE